MPQQEPTWLTPAQQVVWRDSLAAVAWVREQLDADLRKYHLDLNEYEVLVVLSEAPIAASECHNLPTNRTSRAPG